jgi:hypothetical protein
MMTATLEQLVSSSSVDHTLKEISEEMGVTDCTEDDAEVVLPISLESLVSDCSPRRGDCGLKKKLSSHNCYPWKHPAAMCVCPMPHQHQESKTDWCCQGHSHL